MTFTQLLSSEFKFNDALRPQRPYGLLGTATSTIAQLLSSECLSSLLLYVHRGRTYYYGRGDQDVHLDFHTACRFKQQ